MKKRYSNKEDNTKMQPSNGSSSDGHEDSHSKRTIEETTEVEKPQKHQKISFELKRSVANPHVTRRPIIRDNSSKELPPKPNLPPSPEVKFVRESVKHKEVAVSNHPPSFRKPNSIIAPNVTNNLRSAALPRDPLPNRSQSRIIPRASTNKENNNHSHHNHNHLANQRTRPQPQPRDDESLARELQSRIDRQSREDEDLARALQEAEDRSSILHAIGIPQALATSHGFPFGFGNPFQFNSPMNWFAPNRGIPRMMDYGANMAVDVDNMSYEELLELEERIGDAKSKGASNDQIELLPVRVVTEQDVKADNTKKCLVCMCEYEEGNFVKTLPCLHQYHMDCIDQWLSRKNACPICQKEVKIVSEDVISIDK